VSTTDLAERSFLDLAQKVSIPAQTGEDARLGIANLIYPWLLVLDNADDPDVDYQHYFPGKTLGVVMLTSRNDECQQYATKSVALEGLCDREAQELLLKVARVPEDQYHVHGEDPKLVAGLLQSHALALVQAGAYVSRGHCTLADYPRVYKRQRQRLLAFRPSQAQSRYRDVYATFEVSAAMLTTSKTETGRDALQLLSLLAVCASSRLPLPLFEAAWQGTKRVPPDMDDEAEDDDVLLLTPWHVRHIPSLLDIDSDTWDSFRLVEAVSLLKAFSLVLTDSYDGSLSVSMHPLVHAWARDRQGDTEQYQNWLQMGCVAALAHSEGPLWQIHGRQLQSHIEALTAWEVANMFGVESPMLVTRVLVHCGWLLHTMRADVTLFVLMRKIFVRLKLDPLKCKRPWMGVYDLAAGNLINYSKAKEAVALLQEVVRIKEQSLAEDHPSRLASQHALAGAYKANGQVKEAVTLLEEVVRIKEQSLAEDHPDRLASQHALAGAYEANGQVKEAVTLLEEVVRIREHSLAEDHPSRLASQHALAGAYEANGQVKEAVTLLEEVVRIKEQSLAEDHPSRLASQHNLAICMWELGNHKASLSMMAPIVELRRKVLDKSHPDRQISEDWLDYFQQEMAELEPI
jgi:Tetratricopeptide repeat